MKSTINLLGKNKPVLTINVIKIAIIVFIALFLLGNFGPYYWGADSLVYGISAINLANGSWEFTNELLQETGKYEFVPNQWVRTVQNTTAIPYSSVGIYGVSAFSYIVGGYSGLFYIGPIFTILLLIFSERIATNLFGRYVGLITLVIVSTSAIVFRIGPHLLTDNMFAVFIILGCFYLIKFLQERKIGLIFLCSVFFATSAFFRMNGIIFLPLEIFLVVGYFAFQNIKHSKKELNLENSTLITKQTFVKIRGKTFVKTTFLMLIPWLVFSLFLFSYNSYYYGDPFTDHFAEVPGYEHESIVSVFEFDSERLAWVQFYLAPLLPGQPNSFVQFTTSTEGHDSLGILWQSAISLFILITALGISLYRKNKRKEVIVLFTFVIVLLLFYSSDYVISLGAIDQRYMIPALPLSFMFFGFIMHSIWKTNLGRTFKLSKTGQQIFRAGFLIILIIFLIILFFYSKPVQAVVQEGFNFKNPETYAKKYPIDTEGLSENSVILGGAGRRAMEYNVIPFTPYWGYTAGWEWSLDALPKDHIQTLKQIMEEGYEVYAFKNQRPLDKFYFDYIKTEHGIILNDYSKTFCKFEFIKNATERNEIEAKADRICYP